MLQDTLIESQLINIKGSNIHFYSVNNKLNVELMISKVYKVS
jgi:hypothetical protein